MAEHRGFVEVNKVLVLSKSISLYACLIWFNPMFVTLSKIIYAHFTPIAFHKEQHLE